MGIFSEDRLSFWVGHESDEMSCFGTNSTLKKSGSLTISAIGLCQWKNNPIRRKRVMNITSDARIKG
jgi:hypothetical protein